MIGTTVSHYEVLDRLGSGGMGVVYKARDVKLGRFVALKFLSSHRSASEADQRRFTREARAASALDHPNICTVYEIGESEEGRVFIAMAFCDGESLKAKLQRGPLPPEEAVRIAAQVAAGLEAAHAKGVVHRDVKPGNVLVGADGRVKLVDFGIAKLADQTRLTRAGTMVGTAYYLAPELFRGADADPRSDVWSLGVLLYEMLTGTLPFSDDDEKKFIQAVLHSDPEPPSRLVSGVPPELDRIFGKALAKQPADRFQSAGDMRRDLEALLARADELGKTAIVIPSARPQTMESRSSRGPSGLWEERPRRESREVSTRDRPRYEILEPLGGGAMGLVYRARDRRLERTVALKFLPPELTRELDAKERFLQEARAVSALDHPNVCTVHEIGETDDGRLFLAMACYEGETLKQRLERGPLSIDEATDVAKQVAQGLAKAHRQGIVHRDVKPANLMLTDDGMVKILDFGVAKLAGGAVGLTQAGASIGTPAYMSPEQARGLEVDHRADIWSLGAVLYEMLAGRRPFPGEHDQAVLYALFNEEPRPLSGQRLDVPPELERIVARMLAKDPERRYASMAEVVSELQAFRNEPATGTMARPVLPAPRPWWRRPLPAALAAATLAVVFGGYLLLGHGRGAPIAATFTRLTNQEGRESSPSLSPDGTFFVYVKAVDGDADVYLQRGGGGNPINLTADSSADDTQPAFSPDGQQIAFRSEREGGGIFVMGATGESVKRVSDFGFNPAWSPDGAELVVATEGVATPGARATRSQLWRIAVATGEKRLVFAGDAVQPSWSPHGDRIAFWSVVPGSAKRVLWTILAGGGEAVPATDDDFLNWSPAWSPDGRYLYFASDRGGTMNLWRVPIKETSGEVTGEPEPISTPSEWSGLVSLSKDGRRLVYATDDVRSNLERIAFDPAQGEVTGDLAPVTHGSRAVRFGEVSPDGRWIAFDTSAPQEDLFVVQPDGSGLRQLTNDVHKDRIPRWSADGSRVVFYSNRDGDYEVWAIRPDGSGLEKLAAAQDEPLFNPVWSPDGRWVACSLGYKGAAVIDMAQPMGRRVPRLLPAEKGCRGVFIPAAWAPGGQELAVEFAEPGIGVYSLGARSCERLTEHGGSPVWLGDGRVLLYLDGGGIFSFDRKTRETREVLASPRDSTFLGLSASPDGRTLYAVRAVDEGDVWMAAMR